MGHDGGACSHKYPFLIACVILFVVEVDRSAFRSEQSAILPGLSGGWPVLAVLLSSNNFFSSSGDGANGQRPTIL